MYNQENFNLRNGVEFRAPRNVFNGVENEPTTGSNLLLPI